MQPCKTIRDLGVSLVFFSCIEQHPNAFVILAQKMKHVGESHKNFQAIILKAYAFVIRPDCFLKQIEFQIDLCKFVPVQMILLVNAQRLVYIE